MKFKIDENLPAEPASDLVVVGQEPETVVHEGMAGIADNSLFRQRGVKRESC